MDMRHEASVPPVDLTRPKGLGKVPVPDLIRELIARVDGAPLDRELLRLLHELSNRIEPALRHPDNRFAPEHLQESLGTFWWWQQDVCPASVEGENVLELGAGAENPLALVTAMVLMGAAEGHALELTPPISDAEQARALSRLVCWLTLRREVFPKLDLADQRATIAANAKAFDVDRLAAGELLLPENVHLLVAKAERTGLADRSIHRVMSSSFLEHAEDPTAVVREIARVTASGGVSIHNVDVADHGTYWGEVESPVAFLLEAPGQAMVRGANRMRIHEHVRLFESHGFTLLKRNDYAHHEWNKRELRRRVPPYSTMQLDELEPIRSVLVFRRD
ncbi:MAG: methyltransferase domain-containing protein [Planctomycetes bacterium]|nr:methyltransferase domain-containing protein [Planctomycetota bacterium]